MKKLILSLSVVGLFALMSCGDDDEVVDVTAPTITLIEPEMGEEFDAGGEIHFDAIFEDDIALSTYNITIHDNFDGHAHGRLSAEPFAFNQSFTLTGKVDDVHEDIAIPAGTTAGPYHFIVEAIDAAGNSTTFVEGSSVEIDIWIRNNEMARVHFEDEAGVEVVEYEGEVGMSLKFYGEIEDQVGNLDHITIMVGHLEEGEGSGHNNGRVASEEYIFKQEFEVAGQSTVRIEDLLADANIVVTQAHLDELEEGEFLYLIVQVEDEDGNISRDYVEIHFP